MGRSRVVALLGPRQCGKTTLARQIVRPASSSYFDLEDPATEARLDAPMTALAPMKGWVVIDEFHRRPDLFPILRVLADRRPLSARFLILGSASPSLLRSASESLAGRVELVHMSGFTLGEVGTDSFPRHWLRGGFPLAFLARNESDSQQWRRDYVRMVVERDLPQLGMRIPASTMLRFLAMLAHVHGQVWNAADPARSLGIGETTVRRYLDVLADLYLIRQVQPWHANLGKRQVKAPKVFFRDSGLLHQMLGVGTAAQLRAHPRCGASWEGYAFEQALRVFGEDESYFWRTHNGTELDLLLIRKGKRHGVECKYSDAPRLTPSMRVALHDLGLESLTVVYPGSRSYELGRRIRVLPLVEYLKGGKP